MKLSNIMTGQKYPWASLMVLIGLAGLVLFFKELTRSSQKAAAEWDRICQVRLTLSRSHSETLSVVNDSRWCTIYLGKQLEGRE